MTFFGSFLGRFWVFFRAETPKARKVLQQKSAKMNWRYAASQNLPLTSVDFSTIYFRGFLFCIFAHTITFSTRNFTWSKQVSKLQNPTIFYWLKRFLPQKFAKTGSPNPKNLRLLAQLPRGVFLFEFFLEFHGKPHARYALLKFFGNLAKT